MLPSRRGCFCCSGFRPQLYNREVATAVDSAFHEASLATPSSRLGVLEAWHLLSLDAPTVAALWSWFFAQAMRIRLPWHAPLLLALGTWLIYVADRLLDGFRPGPATQLKLRHLFHVRHAWAFLGAALLVGGVVIWLISSRMTAPARHEDTVLFLVALLYLFLVHKSKAFPGQRLPKELCVGVVFAAACAVPAWSRLGSGRLALFPTVTLFAALCWLNCVAIERWENPPRPGSETLATSHASTLWTADHFQGVALALAAFSAGLAVLQVLGRPASPRLVLVSLSASTTALLFARIDRIRANLPPTELRIAADLMLLTPLFFVPFLV